MDHGGNVTVSKEFPMTATSVLRKRVVAELIPQMIWKLVIEGSAGYLIFCHFENLSFL
jgi:hypothetical protein